MDVQTAQKSEGAQTLANVVGRLRKGERLASLLKRLGQASEILHGPCKASARGSLGRRLTGSLGRGDGPS
jgi:hypothetical protein